MNYQCSSFVLKTFRTAGAVDLPTSAQRTGTYPYCLHEPSVLTLVLTISFTEGISSINMPKDQVLATPPGEDSGRSVYTLLQAE